MGEIMMKNLSSIDKFWTAQAAIACILCFSVLSSPAQAASIVLPANDTLNGPKLIPGSDRISAAQNNLATASFEKSYTLGLGYSMAGDLMSAGVVDTSRPGVGGSVYYVRREIKDAFNVGDAALGNYSRLEQHAGAGLSARLGDEIAASVTAKYRYIRPYDLGLSPGDFWTIDVGIAAKIANQWMLGIAAKDLLANEQGLNFRSFEVSIVGQVAPGLELLSQFDFVKLPEGSADTGFVAAENKPSLKFGANYSATPNIELFAHYAKLSNWEQSYTAIGLGYKKDNYNLQYGFRFSPESSKAQYHMIDLAMKL